MAQTTFSIRMDSDVKRSFDEFCAQVGLNASVAFNMFARAALRERRIPFEIATEQDPFYGESNMAHLRRGLQSLNEGKGITKTFDELRAME
jgi:DNA-damage-inducible protein J